VGYLEDSHVLLLFNNLRQYRAVPKRALKPQDQPLIVLVKSRLSAYDYRNPKLRANIATAQSAS
jgi:hypothetical protein